MRLRTDGNGSVLNSQYKGHIRSYEKGNMRQTYRLTKHVGLFGCKGSLSRCGSLFYFSSEEDL